MSIEGGVISSLNFVFCSDEYLLKINKDFLNHNSLTDIITFDLKEKTATHSLGEIYISIDRVAENAKKFEATKETELRRVIFHGVLHLCGYKDKTVPQKKEMRSKEDYYLSLYEMFHVKPH